MIRVSRERVRLSIALISVGIGLQQRFCCVANCGKVQACSQALNAVLLPWLTLAGAAILWLAIAHRK
jgi:hypothetical protein